MIFKTEYYRCVMQLSESFSDFGNIDCTHIFNFDLGEQYRMSNLIHQPILAKGSYYGIIVMILKTVQNTKYIVDFDYNHHT